LIADDLTDGLFGLTDGINRAGGKNPDIPDTVSTVLFTCPDNVPVWK
jgi:hypothetical protein